MLEVNGLTKSYRNTIAVNNASFTINDGRVGILLGPNGAGKSTIIKSIAGLLRYNGSVKIQNEMSGTIKAKKVFAYVPEIPAMFDSLTVREHLEYIAVAYGIADSDNKMDRLLERFELLDKQYKLGNELSKGMMQKVSICCALLIEPKVILLDEPMVGLDPKAIKELKQVVFELKEKGTSVLISTHMLEMVSDIWDEMFVMEKGQIIANYKKEDVKGKEIDELFFGVTGGDTNEGA